MADLLHLAGDPVELTATLIDIPSVSGDEARIAQLIEQSLRAQVPWLEIIRSGNSVLARTNLNRPIRVILAGHIDTVPINNNLPSRRDGELLHGCGSVDMKGGVAVMLRLAALISETARHDITFIWYDCEEIEDARNGLGRIERELPDWLSGDIAIVCEPSNAIIEAGCQGSIRVELTAAGARAHTARAWLGRNAIHAMGDALATLDSYQSRVVTIDGCEYREGLQAVRIAGGVAGNVVPDKCVLTINHRFAPDTSVTEAERNLQKLFPGFDCTVIDAAPGALPGLSAPIAQELVAASGRDPIGKLGWTDVSRFAALGMPALNFGPGDPALAHTQHEHVAGSQIDHCYNTLTRFLN